MQFPALLTNEHKQIIITVMKQINFPENVKKSVLRLKLETLTPEQLKAYLKLSDTEKLKLLDSIKLNFN